MELQKTEGVFSVLVSPCVEKLYTDMKILGLKFVEFCAIIFISFVSSDTEFTSFSVIPYKLLYK